VEGIGRGLIVTLIDYDGVRVSQNCGLRWPIVHVSGEPW
jgi:hypothetical protein